MSAPKRFKAGDKVRCVTKHGTNYRHGGPGAESYVIGKTYTVRHAGDADIADGQYLTVEKTSNGMQFGEFARCFELATPRLPLTTGDRVRCYGVGMFGGLARGGAISLRVGRIRTVYPEGHITVEFNGDANDWAVYNPRQLRRLRKKASK